MERFWHPLAIALVAGTILFFNLGTGSLYDEDEPKNATCGREMLGRGDWVVPTFNDHLRTDKPILIYWLMLVAYHAFGVSEFSARFWSALLGVGTSVLTYYLGRLLYGPRVAVWAGLIIATSLNFDMVARAATPDSTFIFCCTLTLLAFVASAGRGAWQREQPLAPTADLWRAFLPRHYVGYLAVYAAMSLAALAKGPAGILLTSSAMGLFLLAIGSSAFYQHADGNGWRERIWHSRNGLWQTFHPRRIAAVVWAMRPLTGLAVLAVVALPWYVLVSVRTDFAWPAGFLGRHNVGRFVSSLENHRGPIFYYLIAISIGFFPWSVFLLPMFTRWRERMRGFSPGDVFVLCWVAFYVGFFSLAGTKLPNYVLPSYPGLALLAAAMVCDWLTVAAPKRLQVALGFGTISLVGLGLIVGLLITAWFLTPGDYTFALAWIVPLVGGLGMLWLLKHRSLAHAMRLFVVMAIAQSIAMFDLAVVRLSRHHTSPAFAAAAKAVSPTARLCTFEYFEPSLVFYSGGHVAHYRRPEKVLAFLAQEDSFLVTHEKFLPLVQDKLPPDVRVIARHRRFLRKGDVLLLGRSPAVARSTDARIR